MYFRSFCRPDTEASHESESNVEGSSPETECIQLAGTQEFAQEHYDSLVSFFLFRECRRIPVGVEKSGVSYPSFSFRIFEPFLFVRGVNDKLLDHVVFDKVGMRDGLTHVVLLFDIPVLGLNIANKRGAERLRTKGNRL